jgi:hypothetical protein
MTGYLPRSWLAGSLALALLAAQVPGPLAAQFGPRLPSMDQMATWAAAGDKDQLQDAILAYVGQERTGETAALWVQLFAVIEGAQAASSERAVRAVGLGLDDDGLEGAELLMNGVTGAPAAEQAPLMALAAHLADLEEPERGAEIRRVLVAAHPDASEAPEARLLRARYLLEEEDSRPEGLALLEELIVKDPEHPMAPEARRLYQANGGRPAATPTGAPS